MTKSKHACLFLVAVIGLVAGLWAAGGRPLAAQGLTVASPDATWRAEYYNNPALAGAPSFIRQENAINYNWWDGSPAPGISKDNFSVRWTRRAEFADGVYRFAATMDDGMRVYLDGKLIIDDWAFSATHTVSKDVAVSAGVHQIVVEYFDGGGQAVASFERYRVGGSGTGPGWQGGGNGGDPNGAYPNWKGEYFTNQTLTGSPVMVRDDRFLDFNWDRGSPLINFIPNDRFSVRWTRSAPYPAGQYKFILTSDDGSRLYINGIQVVNNWTSPALFPISADYYHPGGVMSLRVDYYEVTGPAAFKLDIIQVPGGSGPGGGGTAGCDPVSGYQARVTANSLTIYSTPSTGSPALTTISRCTLLSLTGFRTADNQWVSLGVPGTTRYDGWAQVRNLVLGLPVDRLTIWDGSTFGSGGPVGAIGGFGSG